MSRYAIVDAANLIFRARHVVRGDAFTKAGMAIHIVFKSLRKLFRDNHCDHIVLCLEGGGSWRYKEYPKYKSKRHLARQADAAERSEKEREEDEVFEHAVESFTKFMTENTRCTVLHQPGVEGDDFIARWIQLHPNDEHIILSGDSDFIQLLAPNVSIYNGVDQRLITTERVTNEYGEEMVFLVDMASGKLKVKNTVEEARKAHNEQEKERKKKHDASEKDRARLHLESEKKKSAADPEYVRLPFLPVMFVPEEFDFVVEPNWWKKALFVKIIRGDSGDSIFSAYPGVRAKSSSKSIGITEAWDDRNGKGYHWNNFMLQKWDKLIGLDENENRIVEEVRVLDEYRINERLIDLTQQPQEVKDLMDMVIVEAVQKEPVGNVGFAFLKFCRENELLNLAREATDHAKYLNAPYARTK
jgi:hypothetical protein